MTDLAQQQQAFLDTVLGSDEDALDPGQAVYRRTILATWRGALAGQFPVVERLVGPAFLGEAARRYGLAHPSVSGNLHDYGARFPAFLATYAPTGSLPYLPDVARLEWALHEAFHAPHALPFDLEALAAVAPEDHPDLRFQLDPAARLVGSPHPVLALWEANQPARDGTPDATEGPSRMLVFRDAEVAWPEALEPDAFSFLEACARGEPLEAIAGRLERPETLPALLQRFVASGVIAGFARG